MVCDELYWGNISSPALYGSFAIFMPLTFVYQ